MGPATGRFDPTAGDYSNTVVAASRDEMKVVDYYLTELGVSQWKGLRFRIRKPRLFLWRNRNLVAHGAKEGVVYLMDADSLGGNDHQTPALYFPPARQRQSGLLSGAGHLGRSVDSAGPGGPDLAHYPNGWTARRKWPQISPRQW